MSDKNIKFTDEEIKSLNDLSAEYQRIQASFGQLHVQKINAAYFSIKVPLSWDFFLSLFFLLVLIIRGYAFG